MYTYIHIREIRGFYSSIILDFKGWNSQVHVELPRKLESSNLRRDEISREIGRVATTFRCS